MTTSLSKQSRPYAAALLKLLGADYAPSTAIGLSGTPLQPEHLAFAAHFGEDFLANKLDAEGDAAGSLAARRRSNLMLDFVSPRGRVHGFHAVRFLQSVGRAAASHGGRP